MATEKLSTPEADLHKTALGRGLRALRRERGVSMNEVANATGLSKSFLSLVESGRSDISIGRLIRLVDFYGVGIDDLLPSANPHDPLVVRRDERRELASPSEGITTTLLTPDSKRAMLPMIAVFEPGAATDEWRQHQGEEFVHVLNGTISLNIDEREPLVLEQGDSAYFPSGRRHSYRNVGRSSTQIFVIVTPPTL